MTLTKTEAELLLNSVRGIDVYNGSPARLDAKKLYDEGLVELQGSRFCGDHTQVEINEAGRNYIVERLTK